MAKKSRGRLIATELVTIIAAMPSPAYPFTVSRKRLPVIKKEDLPSSAAVVTVAPMTKSGDEQDRGVELLEHGISVVVTANVGAESDEADLTEDLTEQIQDFLTLEENRVLIIEPAPAPTDLDFKAELELPYVNEPIFIVPYLREHGILQSMTIFNYLVEKNRNP